MNRLIHRITDAYRRHTSVAAYVVIFGGVFLTAAVVSALTLLAFIYLPNRTVYAPAAEERVDAAMATTTRYLLKVSEPTRLVIPKLGIDARFEEALGLSKDQAVEVPKEYTTVGWYNGSPTPGELGPAIILGHVDSYKGAAVFYHLGALEAGDTFKVVRADGSAPTFRVEKVERYSQNDFPTELVYGPIDHAGIRLITCSGTYDKGTLRYSHNTVVYGRLVDPRDNSSANASSTTPSN